MAVSLAQPGDPSYPFPTAQAARKTVSDCAKARGCFWRKDRGFLVVSGAKLQRPLVCQIVRQTGNGYQVDLTRLALARRRYEANRHEQVVLALVAATGTIRIAPIPGLERYMRIHNGVVVIMDPTSAGFNEMGTFIQAAA